MGFRFPLFCVFLALSAAAGISAAGHSAPPPATDCSSLVLTMADCLSYVTADGSGRASLCTRRRAAQPGGAAADARRGRPRRRRLRHTRGVPRDRLGFGAAGLRYGDEGHV
ncbi:hypothetical protein CASFOL_014215 [Castilleja foliolosa]|uniref:Uncharacterized protein n=1 Tax=Castilleja foliolosa TaxID=1961234 RepID=A0ABD3CW62_9LAMI